MKRQTLKRLHNLQYLNNEEQQKLLNLLKRHQHLFDGTIGKWTGQQYKIELKPEAMPYHARAFPIPKFTKKL